MFQSAVAIAGLGVILEPDYSHSKPCFGCEMLDLALKSVRIRLHKGLGVIGGDFSL